jgi:hypothetical protein
MLLYVLPFSNSDRILKISLTIYSLANSVVQSLSWESNNHLKEISHSIEPEVQKSLPLVPSLRKTNPAHNEHPISKVFLILSSYLCLSLQSRTVPLSVYDISWQIIHRIYLIVSPNNININTKKTKFRGRSPQANYTDRATAACRWS